MLYRLYRYYRYYYSCSGCCAQSAALWDRSVLETTLTPCVSSTRSLCTFYCNRHRICATKRASLHFEPFHFFFFYCRGCVLMTIPASLFLYTFQIYCACIFNICFVINTSSYIADPAINMTFPYVFANLKSKYGWKRRPFCETWNNLFVGSYLIVVIDQSSFMSQKFAHYNWRLDKEKVWGNLRTQLTLFPLHLLSMNWDIKIHQGERSSIMNIQISNKFDILYRLHVELHARKPFFQSERQFWVFPWINFHGID